MAVAHRASIASGSTNPTTSMTITIPVSVATNDVLFCAFTSRDHVAATSVPTCTDNDTGGNVWVPMWNSADRKAWIFWKRATSATASKTITVAGCVGSCSGGVSAYSGAATTGSPYDQISVETNAAANETHAGITIVQTDTELCFAVFNYANDNAVTVVSAATKGAYTSRWEKLSTGGSDCATTFWSQPESAAGATGATTWTQADGTTYSVKFVVVPVADTLTVTTVLDNFNRADESPIAGIWSANPIYTGQQTARVLSNQLAKITGQADAQPYVTASYNADATFQIKLIDRTAFTIFELWARASGFNSGGSLLQSGYTVSVRSNNLFRVSRMVNDTETVLHEFYFPFVNNDSIAIRTQGSLISAWHAPNGGTFRKVIEVTDSTHSSGGLTGIVCAGSTTGAAFGEDFSGGNIVTGVPRSWGFIIG